MNSFSNNSNRVEFHVGQSNATNKCAVIQYNVNPVLDSSHNYIMNLDPNGNLPTNRTITSPTITSINNALNPKAPLSHTYSISDVTNLQTTLDSKASISRTHISSDVSDIQTYVDNRTTSKFNQMFDLLHPIGSVMILQNALSVLGAIPTFTDNHLYYSWNETTWEYLPDAVFIRNETIDSNTHEETGATLTPSESNTHNSRPHTN